MEIKKISSISQTKISIPHKVYKIKENNKKKIVLEIPLQENFIYIEIHYFFYNNLLIYKTKIEDPYFMLDKDTKKMIEDFCNSFILNKC